MEFFVVFFIIGFLGFAYKSKIIHRIFNKYIMTPERKGAQGERRVKRIIGETTAFDGLYQFVIHDLLIKNEDGTTAQIDHIVINKNGLFVIETKNYAGQIYGDENNQQWTQVLNFGRTKKQFYNPIKQNATHIFRLKEVVTINMPIHSVIVFVQNNIEHINSDKVITCQQIRSVLDCDLNHHVPLLEMQKLYQKLLKIKTKTVVTKEEHINNISSMQDGLKNYVCPRCKGILIMREGKYGEFWGCQNYPKCSFTKKG